MVKNSLVNDSQILRPPNNLRRNYWYCIGLIVLIVLHGFAQNSKVYRLNEAVGDSIDLAERNQYGLFPGLADFQSAQFLIKKDSVYLAEVSYGKPDSLKIMLLQLTNQEVERIKFMIENPNLIEERKQSDTATSNLVLARFWSTIETRRIPDSVDTVRHSDKGDRLTWVIRGTTIGAAIGDLTAAAVVSSVPGEMRVTTAQRVMQGCIEQTTCSGCFGPPEPIYTINLGTYCLCTGLITGVGTVGGLILGNLISKKPSLDIQKVQRTKKGTAIIALSWIYSPMIAAGLSIALGFTYRAIVNSSKDKKAGDGIEMLPVSLFGLGVTVELVRLGYLWANAVDRREAMRKAHGS